VAVLCVLAGLTVNHVSHWRNDDSLLDHTLAVNPTSVMGNNNRGFILSEQNKPDKYREAVVFFQMALKTDPMHGESHLNLGWALASIGDIGRAKEELEKARILMPGEPWAHFNLGCVALFVENDAEEAARYFENAVALDPEFLKAHVNLAQAQMKLERFDDAQSSWQTALSLAHPDSREARDIRRSMEAARKERK